VDSLEFPEMGIPGKYRGEKERKQEDE